VREATKRRPLDGNFEFPAKVLVHHSLLGIRYLRSSLHLRKISDGHEDVTEVVDVVVVFLSGLLG
jgi:hypothetical protein